VVVPAVAGPTTTSISAIARTGLKKCSPMNRSGSGTAVASSAIGMLAPFDRPVEQLV
jgi:hypothetical protein